MRGEFWLQNNIVSHTARNHIKSMSHFNYCQRLYFVINFKPFVARSPKTIPFVSGWLMWYEMCFRVTGDWGDIWQTHANVKVCKCRGHTFCIRNAFASDPIGSVPVSMDGGGWETRGKLEKVSMWLASECLAWRFAFYNSGSTSSCAPALLTAFDDWPNSFVSVFTGYVTHMASN